MPKKNLAQRKRLKECGFVRVDGLHPHSYIFGFGKPIHANPSDLGCYGKNLGILTIITREGEIWISWCQEKDTVVELLQELCPNGNGATNPLLGWHDNIHLAEILPRLSDPDWQPKPKNR